MSEYERKLDENTQQMSEMNQAMKRVNGEVQVFKAKVDTFEEIVKSMEVGKRTTQKACQDNIKLAVKLKDSEEEIRGLREKLKESRKNSEAKPQLLDDKLNQECQTRTSKKDGPENHSGAAKRIESRMV